MGGYDLESEDKAMKQFLWHVTPEENVKSILRHGLKRKGFAVHCSENPESWWTPEMAIFKVRITGIKSEMTTFLPELDEILIWGDVPPERLFQCKPTEVFSKKLYKELCRRYKYLTMGGQL